MDSEAKVFRLKLQTKYNTVCLPALARELMWKLAWDEGHAYGLPEVERYYDELVDIAAAITGNLSLGRDK